MRYYFEFFGLKNMKFCCEFLFIFGHFPITSIIFNAFVPYTAFARLKARITGYEVSRELNKNLF